MSVNRTSVVRCSRIRSSAVGLISSIVAARARSRRVGLLARWPQAGSVLSSLSLMTIALRSIHRVMTLDK